MATSVKSKLLRIHGVHSGIIEEFHHHKLLQGHQVLLGGLSDTSLINICPEDALVVVPGLLYGLVPVSACTRRAGTALSVSPTSSVFLIKS